MGVVLPGQAFRRRKRESVLKDFWSGLEGAVRHPHDGKNNPHRVSGESREDQSAGKGDVRSSHGFKKIRGSLDEFFARDAKRERGAFFNNLKKRKYGFILFYRLFVSEATQNKK